MPSPATGLCSLSAVELRARLSAGDLTAVEVCAAFLERVQRLDPELHAFHTVTAERALRRARHLDAARRANPEAPRPPLWGIPFADKDLFDRAGVRTTLGSRAFADRIADEDAPLVRDLDAAGGVSLGKTATPELGMNGYTENLVFPPPRNPWAPNCGPGGSSGGAAVAVAARMLPLAPGNDGGGSIRIPAAACGLVGLKPGRGLVPGQSGVGTLGGFATAGAIARDAADAALLLDAMAPRDADGGIRATMATAEAGRDAGAGPERSFIDQLAAWRRRGDGVAGLRIGVSTESPWSQSLDIVLEEPACRALGTAARILGAAGADLDTDVPVPVVADYARHFRTLWHTNMAAAVAALPPEQYALLEPMTRWAVEQGRQRSAVEVAQAVETFGRFERDAVRLLRRYDLLLTPVLAQTPRPIGWFDPDDPEHNFAQQCQYEPYTSWINVVGLPAITVPVLVADGVPMGVQLVGGPGTEGMLLGVAAQLQDVTGSASWEPESSSAVGPNAADPAAAAG